MKYLDYIDDYFKGEYSEAKTRQFEERLENDPLFAEEVAFYLSAMQVLRREARTEKTNRFRAIYEEQQTPARTKGSYIRIVYFAGAAAVVFGLLLAAYLFMRPAGKQQMAQSFIDEKLDRLPVAMTTNKADSLKKAKDYYNSKEFPKAMAILEVMAANYPDNGSILQCAGITSLQLGQYDKAIKWFHDLGEQREALSNPGVFYEALTYMKRNEAGDKDKAKALLQKVVDNGLDKKDIAANWLKNW